MGAREMSRKLIPDAQVRKSRYGVSASTIWRWDHDLALGFPRAIVINGRNYRDEEELDAFDQKLLARRKKRLSESGEEIPDNAA
jgi:hypothetical protein